MMSDYPFKGQLKYITAQLTGDTFESAIVTVMNRVNYNHVKFYNPLSWLGYIRYDQVESIMNSYYNLVDQGAREYSADDALKGEATVWTLIKAVALTSAQTNDLSREVLDQLEYATADGTIKTAQYIKPKTYESFKVTREKPDAVQTTAGWLASNVLWIAALAGGIYVAKRTGLLDKGLNAIKGKVSGGSKGLSDKPRTYKKRTKLNDNLFGKDEDMKYLWKSGEEIGITGDKKKIEEKYGKNNVKILAYSPNHEDLIREREKHTKTPALFDGAQKLSVGTEIYNAGDMANNAGFGTIVKNTDGRIKIKMDDGRIIEIQSYQFSEKYSGNHSTRFVTKEAYNTYRNEQLEKINARLGKRTLTDKKTKKKVSA